MLGQRAFGGVGVKEAAILADVDPGSDHLGRIARDDGSRWDRLRNDRTRADHTIVADLDPRKDQAATPDEAVGADTGMKVGQSLRTLPKDVAFHPVSDLPLHVDFLRLGKDAKVEVLVPVVFTNEEASPGLKRGGVLNIVRHELDLICDPELIPSEIEIDVTGREVGDSIHISSVKLPKGSASAITDRDYTIATIVAPSALKSSEGEAEAAEGE